jgi:dihydrofolate reductase
VNFSLVVAMSRSGLIGRDGTIPWRLPRDLKHFRRLTWGKPIIMGRKTHQGLGRPLPGRTNIVLTKQSGFSAPGCLIASDRDQAIALAQATGSPEAMIIGGSQVYREFLPLRPTIHVTLVEGDFAGDITFPIALIGSSDWVTIHEERWPADEANPHDARYLIMIPVRPAID